MALPSLSPAEYTSTLQLNMIIHERSKLVNPLCGKLTPDHVILVLKSPHQLEKSFIFILTYPLCDLGWDATISHLMGHEALKIIAHPRIVLLFLYLLFCPCRQKIVKGEKA